MGDINIVEVDGLTVLLGGRRILDGVSFTINAGSFTGLIGPNGAGKTTLLRALLGLIRPDAGAIRVFGHSPGHAHNMIGYVPQTRHTDPNFPISVRDVVMMGRYGVLGIGRRPGGADREAVADALDKVGMSALADKKFGALSGGERQKALIARALCGGPRLLLLDEPTTGVDAVAQDSFYAMLEQLKTGLKMTILLVSHDVGVITNMVDDLICLNQRVFCHGAAPDVVKEGMIGQAYGTKAEIVIHGHHMPHRMVKRHEHGEDEGHD